ncbi:MAG: hypothetical protein L7F78_25030, partial [Syntrophales bacterium LBB04]|nr:hypothetical protein [Syntrophales bacterium LBB04]
EAVSFLVKNGLEGRILCFFDWGEYLTFRRYPGSKVSFDGRLETIYPPEIIKENLDFTFGREGWRKLLVEHPPDLVMVKPELRSFTLMKEEKDWSLLYRDEVCAIFQRAGPVRRFQEPRRQGDLTTLPMRDALGKGEL